MTVDMRIRIDGEPASIEPAELFEVTLPDLFRSRHIFSVSRHPVIVGGEAEIVPGHPD
jgi:hypothetical protein